MKILITYGCLFIFCVTGAFAQTMTCNNVENIGVYQYDQPTWPVVGRIEVEGGANSLSYGYDATLRLWIYHFTPLEEKDYTIRYKEKLAGATVTNNFVDSYSVFRTQLVLNSQITAANYTAKATHIIRFSTGFSVSSSTTTLNTELVNCGGGRVATVTGIQLQHEAEEEEQIAFSFFPNPLSGNILKLKVRETDLPGKVEIVSSTGAVLTEKKLNLHEEELTIPDRVLPGLYIVMFRSEKGLSTRSKLLIK
jgi:hypothetical protein